MDFELPAELQHLADEAAEVARKWSTTTPFPEDSWIVGHDPALAQELAARGWIGMTWPVEYGGGGRSARSSASSWSSSSSPAAPPSPPPGSPTARWARASCSSAPRSSGSAGCPASWPARRCGASACPSPTTAPTSPASAPAPCPPTTGRRLDRQRPEGLDLRRRGGRLDLPASPAPIPTPSRTPGCRSSSSTCASPGVEARRIVDMTGNDHFCEVHLHDVRVPGAHLVGELNGSFRQVMRQMEHERGGIDRLVSNRLLYRGPAAQRLGRHDGPARPPGAGRHRDRLPHRSPARAPRDPGPGAAAVLGGHEDLLHRVRAAPRRASPPASPGRGPRCWDPGGDLGSRIARAVCYAPAYTIMGGTAQILRNILGERTLGLPLDPQSLRERLIGERGRSTVWPRSMTSACPTALLRMPAPASSSAAHLVRPTSPNFDAPCGRTAGCRSRSHREERLDGAAFVHGPVAVGSVLEGEGEVEHLAGLDGPVADELAGARGGTDGQEQGRRGGGRGT